MKVFSFEEVFIWAQKPQCTKVAFFGKIIFIELENAKKTLQPLHNHSHYCVLLDSLLSWHVNYYRCLLRMSHS